MGSMTLLGAGKAGGYPEFDLTTLTGSTLLNWWDPNSGYVYQTTDTSTPTTTTSQLVGRVSGRYGSDNLTQATEASRPTYLTSAAGPYSAAVFDGTQTIAVDTADNAQAYWIVAAFIMTELGVSGTNDFLWDGVTAAQNAAAMSREASTSLIRFHPYAGAATPTTAYQRWCEPGVNVVAIKYTGAATEVWMNGVKRTTISAGTQALNGITWGALSDGTRSTKSKLLHLSHWESISASDIVSLNVGLCNQFGAIYCADTSAKFCAFIGDSRMGGSNAVQPDTISFQHSPPAKHRVALGNDWYFANFAYSGATAQTYSETANAVAAIRVGDAKKVFHVCLGYNDSGARTAAQIEADVYTITDAIIAAGGYVILHPILRGLPARDAVVDATNARFASNAVSGGHASVYLSAQTSDAILMDTSNTTYWQVDTIHLNDAGEAYWESTWRYATLAA